MNNHIPKKPGVYLAFEKGVIVYVGETGNLYKRFKDLRDTRNHPLRVKIGNKNKKECKEGGSRQKCPKPIEKKIDRWLTKRMKFTWLHIPLGRKEIEEKIICSSPKPKYNHEEIRRCGL